MNDSQARVLFLGVVIFGGLLALLIVAAVPFFVGLYVYAVLEGDSPKSPELPAIWLLGAFASCLAMGVLFLLIGFSVWAVKFWSATLA